MNDPLGNVDAIVRKQVETGSLTGAIVLVRNSGGTIYHEAYGVADSVPDFRLHRDTVYWAASMTKPVIAVATMLAVEEGKLSLDDEVAKYIPSFGKQRMVRTLKPDSPPLPPFPPSQPPGQNAPKPTYDLAPSRTPLRVRHLITMTSGLQTIGVPNEDLSPIQPGDTLETRIPRLADAPLDFEPGTRWHYSNATGFDVLGYVVQVAVGMRLGQFLQERVFDPLSMTDTSFGLRSHLEDRTLKQAPPHMALGVYESGSAGLNSTANDYSNFGHMLLSGGSPNGKRILTQQSVSDMTTNQVGEMFAGMTPREYASRGDGKGKGVGYGLGLGIVTDDEKSNRAVPTGSFGWDGIGSRRFWVIPSLDTVIVMLAMGPDSDKVQIEIEGAVVQALRRR